MNCRARRLAHSLPPQATREPAPVHARRQCPSRRIRSRRAQDLRVIDGAQTAGNRSPFRTRACGFLCADIGRLLPKSGSITQASAERRRSRHVHGRNTRGFSAGMSRYYWRRISARTWRRAAVSSGSPRGWTPPAAPRGWLVRSPSSLEQILACFPFPLPHDPIGGKRGWIRG
jgi:hypothetical protein